MRPSISTASILLSGVLAFACSEEDPKSSAPSDEGTTESGTTEDDGSEDSTTDDGGGDGGDGGGDDGGDDGGEDVELSEANAYAESGCALMESEPVLLAIGASASEANTAVIVPDDETTWMLQMPESGDGWFSVEVPDWMSIVHFFTEEGVELEIMGGEPFSEVLRNGACPDAGISDQRWAFHEWGSYTIRVAEGAPSEVWFTLVKED